jgi:hypothetical protein
MIAEIDEKQCISSFSDKSIDFTEINKFYNQNSKHLAEFKIDYKNIEQTAAVSRELSQYFEK